MNREDFCYDGDVTEKEMSGVCEFALCWAGVFTGPKEAVKGRHEGVVCASHVSGISASFLTYYSICCTHIENLRLL